MVPAKCCFYTWCHIGMMQGLTWKDHNSHIHVNVRKQRV
ncbi:hypothetical protein ApDm4_0342 [Acetobacter pomorum]|nr:hypothetical protein ApDm4_0342 [Acetobacter pomorum]